jgi:peptidoglycan/LPS O-acetylase OafA/YrhL
MGYQPGLDGLRAVSVLAVICYHAGFTWMVGGFLGVEVFFVVSGYLITTLLIEERSKASTINLKAFWIRRIRRLLPALAAVLVATSLWVMLIGSAEQVSQMRRDLPWAVLYTANWGQILGDVPYFASGTPSMLRHLWSLAVEEQWYVIWPLAFVALQRLGQRWRLRVLACGVLAAWLLSWWIHRGAPSPTDGVFGLFHQLDRTNVAYLSTATRAAGLLLGACAAYVWRPWQRPNAGAISSRGLDVSLGVSLGVLMSLFIGAHLTQGYMYPWGLALTAVSSLVAIGVVVHPRAVGSRWVFGSNVLTAIGRRSYGLYLWHWPVFVVFGATQGSMGRFLLAGCCAGLIAEASYRWIETPVRQRRVEGWWRSERAERVRAPLLVASSASIIAIATFYIAADTYDAAVGGEEVAFSIDGAQDDLTPSVTPDVVTGGSAAPTSDTGEGASSTTDLTPSTSAVEATTTTQPILPRSLAIVGDSSAHSLAINLPSGIDQFFDVSDGSLDGCSVWDAGRVSSARAFSNEFAYCVGWQSKWAAAATDTDVALVVIGAWDVFDLVVNEDGAEQTIVFGSDDWDERFLANLSTGVTALREAGAEVALLEVACMRPQDVEGAGVPALPERGDDSRVAHLNELLRSVSDGADVWFIEGPDAWCANEEIATSLNYRWDGVHVYTPGANLIYETIATSVLAIPVERR